MVRKKRRQKSKIGICSYHLCKKRTKVYSCKSCGEYYCKEHAHPKIPTRFIDDIKSAEGLRSWRRKDGHPCSQYAEWRIKKEKEDLDKRWEFYERLKERFLLGEVKYDRRSLILRRPETAGPKKTREIKIPVSVLVFITLVALSALYFYTNPNIFDTITKWVSNFLGNITKNLESTTTTTFTTTTTTKIQTRKCCCMVSCDMMNDCGWLESCFSVYTECPNSYCGGTPPAIAITTTSTISASPPTTTTTTLQTININSLEKQIHDLINTERIEHGLSALSWNNELGSIARFHSVDMISRNYFSHNDPEGNGPTERYLEHGYFCHIDLPGGYYIEGGSENIAGNFLGSYYYLDGSIAQYKSQQEIAGSVVNGWMNSPGHRENILRSYWTREGIGVAIGNLEYEGTIYITENFC